MKAFRIRNGYLLRLDRGEEVVTTILKFVQESKIGTASLSAIGAISNCVLGYFDRERKTYISKNFNDAYELISLNGNITFLDGKPSLHCHVCIGDAHCNAFGGHLFSATVSITTEIFVVEAEKRIIRTFAKDSNLNLIDLQENA